MHTATQLPNQPEPSGERLFFEIAIAFIVVTAVIIAASFAPVGAAVALSLGAIGVGVWLVLAFLNRVIQEDDH
jgi:hypothetical protein